MGGEGSHSPGHPSLEVWLEFWALGCLVIPAPSSASWGFWTSCTSILPEVPRYSKNSRKKQLLPSEAIRSSLSQIPRVMDRAVWVTRRHALVDQTGPGSTGGAVGGCHHLLVLALRPLPIALCPGPWQSPPDTPEQQCRGEKA